MAQASVNAPRVFAVVLGWNSGEDIVKCLTQLTACRYPALEIVVVDNASGDRTPERVRELFPTVTLRQNDKNVGFAEGNNIGMRYALAQKAEYLFLVNDDAFVEPDALQIMIDTAESDAAIGFVGPALVSFHDPTKVYYGAQLDMERLAPQEQLMTTPRTDAFEMAYVPGCALLVKANVAEKIGLLDPAYFAYWEDTDWCTRAWRGGFRVVVEPRAGVAHRGTLDQVSEKSFFAPYLYRRNQFYFARKFKPLAAQLRFVRRYTYDSLSEIRATIQHGMPLARTDAVTDGWWAGITGHTGEDFAKAPAWLKTFVRTHYEGLRSLLYPINTLRARFPLRTTLRRLLGIHTVGS